ncbi:putative ABC transport system permease protein [Aquimarina sp. EL_43]|uniref:ABC transporter permease n=1 Tax=unclassified Aquimarina TaxID=2627091 RepID=UPI0018CA332D|nr:MULTISPECIES: ABC transporter permease [unclassified Aquimarina]MBG6131487.1 putative ABC transport system permease protein [Aquimarina sp. EL_35]MBG6151947.1 putative ABC transport system permease protein [Aquimarina sp. EL_32]MBG6170109.1 putative ABC transport system permease protein [Aquimarina sp. EL_43]
MLKNYLKIAWRNLLKNKGYSAINIGGLAIGMTCFLLITLFIRNELSYDSYHENADNIYRVVHHSSKDNIEDRWIWGNAPVGPALKNDFSEVVEKVQFSGRSDVLLNYNERSFQEANCFYVDPTVFDVFSWPLVSGNPETALKAPHSIVLTESIAKKYFGNEDPMGKSINGFGGRASDGIYTVTGIMKDVPSNSHFSFDILMSMSSFHQTRPDVFDAWGYVDFYTYFLVADNFDQAAFQAKIPGFLKKNRPSEQAEYYYNISFEPLKDTYLNSEAARQPGITGNLSNIYIFVIIGFFILIIACINFMNLATARSLERAKEVGVRKVIGADKKSLIYQFLGESLLMVFLSAIIGLVLVIICLPWMNTITGKQFLVNEIFNGITLSLYFGTALVTGILAGSYPAFILSNFKPSSVLKGVFRTSKKGVNLRKGLVVFQFSLSIALIASTVIVYSQLDYMLNKNLGFDREQQLVIDFNWDGQVRDNIETIKSEFLNHPDISSVSASRTVPGGHFPAAGTDIETKEGPMKSFSPFLYEVDVDFIPHYDIEVVAGRAYSRDFATDTVSSMIINEAAAKSFGYADPLEIIGKRFEQWGKEGTIIGVVKDFNYLSLHQEVAPLALRLEPGSSRYFSLQIKSQNLQATIKDIEDKWSALVPHRPFLYSFLDDSFNAQYEADFKFKKLFTMFSFLAILIACLGLLGLAIYSAMQRTKEIGVRKVLGAEVTSIVTLLSKDFIKLVGIAIVIATPFSWYAMNKWLNVYAYRVEVNWWVFALAGFLALTIALLTVSFHAIKAARTNPIKSLRTE